MYLVSHRIDQDANKARVFAIWKNRFHQPAAAALSVQNIAHPGEATLIEGSVKDVHGALFGCAEIAWSLGWRPRGLMPSLMALIQSFKIHPMARPGQ